MIEEKVIRSELQRAIAQVWRTSLHIPLEPSIACEWLPEDRLSIAGGVTIDGAWTGMLVLETSQPLINLMTQKLYGSDSSEQIAPDICEDLLRELSNMLAGNVKSFLPEPCTLGLPTIFHTDVQRFDANGYAPLVKLCFMYQAEPIIVTMFRCCKS